MGKKRAAEVSDAEIIRVFSEVGTALQTARRTGISQGTVFRVLEKNGIPRKSVEDIRNMRATFNAERASEIRREYEGGASLTELAAKHGGSHVSIKRAIRASGGTVVPVSPALSESEKATILDMVSKGVSQMKVSLHLGRSQASVTRYCRAQGVRNGKATGASHGRWRGGRIKDTSGYWRVRLDPADPLAEMRLHDGYVSEHRLVLARKLGRPLLRSETVHHIDGDKGNNAPENLQLRQGKHGKNVVLVCRACGSHDVGPEQIADAP